MLTHINAKTMSYECPELQECGSCDMCYYYDHAGCIYDDPDYYKDRAFDEAVDKLMSKTL